MKKKYVDPRVEKMVKPLRGAPACDDGLDASARVDRIMFGHHVFPHEHLASEIMKEVKLETPAQIEEAISTISSLAAHLMNVRGADWVEVAVSPIGKKEWHVTVRYEGFVVSTSKPVFADAIRAMLTILTNRVAKRLEEGQELLKL